jgi:NAD+ diphosphatase
MAPIDLDRSNRLTFAGGRLDRAAHLRQSDTLPEGPARMVVVGPDSSVLLESPTRLARLPVSLTPEAELVLLGEEDGGVLLAGEGASADMQYTSLREAAAALPAPEAGTAAYAVGLLNWHRAQRFCGRCGALTQMQRAGHRRQCPACGQRYHPRTDPVITMVVRAGERCLLTRRQAAGANMWSALAGFVEPGETPEAAVAREAREEVGVEVRSVEYVAAQPWPFPLGLMLGYRAFADPDPPDVRVHAKHELVDARWFTREELRADLADGSVALPPPIAIGHHLIRDWLDGPV